MLPDCAVCAATAATTCIPKLLLADGATALVTAARPPSLATLGGSSTL